MKRYVRAAGVPFRYVDVDVILAPLDTDTFEALDGPAADVWSLLDAPRSVDEVVEALAAVYAADRVRLKEDVESLFSQLLATSVVEVVDRHE